MNSSGLLALKIISRNIFLIQDIPAEVFLGLRARNWWQKSRVVLMTGKFDGSDTPRPMAAGQFGPPTKKSSNNPRELAEWNREVTVSIFAVDPTNTTSEEAQNTALENLIECDDPRSLDRHGSPSTGGGTPRQPQSAECGRSEHRMGR